ncbi:MAG: NnrS family protein [Deltaproteobacteria bacterium]|nr:NnrS family protein [Deltaproteobacteria bacterium]
MPQNHLPYTPKPNTTTQTGARMNKTSFLKILEEPFRLFFILGTIFCLIGVLYWPFKVFGWGLFDSYSSAFHSQIQIFGFMLAFIVGFITTAFPKLTQAPCLDAKEFLSLLGIYTVLILSIFIQESQVTYITFILTLLYLVSRLVKRFFLRKRNPPSTFIFLPFAFISAILGGLLCLLGYSQNSYNLISLGQNLIYNAFILFLLLGIGGFLIKSILGWAQPLPESNHENLKKFKTSKKDLKIHFSIALLLFLTFIFPQRDSSLTHLIRAILISFELIWNIKVHKSSISGKLTAKTLQMTLWFLIAGSWLVVFCPDDYYVDLIHFSLIGGFAITTFAVATRVIFSHCGHSSFLNSHYLFFTISITLMTIALLTRVFVFLTPNTYFEHLGYAGLLWTAGLLIWSAKILIRIFPDTFRKVS